MNVMESDKRIHDFVQDKPQKFAFLILAHRNPEQLLRLVQRLNDSQFDVYVHIDAKSDIKPFESILSNYGHVKLVQRRVNIVLNDFSLVQATCELLAEAYSGGEYLYYTLLTGQDYPIKPNHVIKDVLTSAYPMAYVDMYGVEEAKLHGVRWVENIGCHYYSQDVRRLLLKIVGPKRYYRSAMKWIKIPALFVDRLRSIFGTSPKHLINELGYTYCAGSHFWSLPDYAVEHILECYGNDLRIKHIFCNISAPEESFFQTVLSTCKNLRIPDPYVQFTSHLEEMDNPALRMIKWYENDVHTSGHPAIWTKKDLQMLKQAKALFARKFEYIDDGVLDAIDAELL